MSALQFNNKWVMVTGASSGLGRQLCVELATHHGAKIFAVARRKEKLQSLKDQLSSTTEVIIESVDLTDDYALKSAFDTFTAQHDLHAVILNAGMTQNKPDHTISIEKKSQMIQTNVLSTVQLAHLSIEYMLKAQGSGGLLFIASMASRVPTPNQALYSGTKAFLYNYVHSIAWELRKEPFSVSICMPGGIKTEMIVNNDMSHMEKFLMPVEKAAKKTIKGFAKRKVSYALTFSDAITMSFANLSPKGLLMRVLDRLYGK